MNNPIVFEIKLRTDGLAFACDTASNRELSESDKTLLRNFFARIETHVFGERAIPDGTNHLNRFADLEKGIDDDRRGVRAG